MLKKGQGDGFAISEANSVCRERRRVAHATPGSESMACWRLRIGGNPGDPVLSYMEVSMPDKR